MTGPWIVAALACRAPSPPPGDGPQTETSPTDTDTDTPAETGSPPDTGTPPTVPPYDCGALTDTPAVASLQDLYPSEDFAFDDEGNLISATGTQLVKQAYPPGAVVPFVSTETDPSSMRMLPTGDLVYANIDTQSLFRVQMDGVREVVVGGFGYATGIDVHPSGMVFIGDAGTIKRVHPYEGSVEVVFDVRDHFGAGIINGLTFSDGWDRLYMGVNDAIWSVAVDADGFPTGQASPVWEAPVPGELLGMGFDACGNLYALFGGRLLRFVDVADRFGEEPQILMDGGLNTTNLQWGSGLGGWDALKVYVTDRNPQRPPFYEVDVGVPSKFYW